MVTEVIHFPFLQLMKSNRIVFIALPSHTSHVLQPLDITVFEAYKSFFGKELHRAARVTSKLNTLSVAACVSNAYSKAFVSPTIRSGFVRSGMWKPETFKKDISALKHIFGDCGISETSVEFLLRSFERKERSLLRDVDVEEEGRIRIEPPVVRMSHRKVSAKLSMFERNERREHKSDRGRNPQILPLAFCEGRPALRPSVCVFLNDC